MINRCFLFMSITFEKESCMWGLEVWKGNGMRGRRDTIMYNIDDVYQCTAYWLLLYQRIMMQLFSAIVDIYLFYDGGGDWYAKWSLLARSHCRVSDTQVTLKACVSLVYIYIGWNWEIPTDLSIRTRGGIYLLSARIFGKIENMTATKQTNKAKNKISACRYWRYLEHFY